MEGGPGVSTHIFEKYVNKLLLFFFFWGGGEGGQAME